MSLPHQVTAAFTAGSRKTTAMRLPQQKSRVSEAEARGVGRTGCLGVGLRCIEVGHDLRIRHLGDDLADDLLDVGHSGDAALARIELRRDRHVAFLGEPPANVLDVLMHAEDLLDDSNGLTAGEGQDPPPGIVRDPRLLARAGRRAGAVSRFDPRRARDLRRARAHRGRLPAARQAGYLAGRAGLYARQGDVVGMTDMKRYSGRAKVPDKQVMADLDATAPGARHDKGDTTHVGITGFCWGGRITWLYAAHQLGIY